MDTLRIGLIGLGNWPREAYLPVLREIRQVEVVAVAARSGETREFARDEFGQSLATYADYHDLLTDESVEAVMLALPNELHSEATIAAAQSGKHLFFEPPVGLSRQEVQAAIAALAKTDAVVQADLELRYLPVVDRALALIGDGAIGEPLMVKVRLRCDWGYGERAWVEEEVGEQGFFPWLGCWYLDVLDVFLQKCETAYVVGGYDRNGHIMDHGWATLTYPGQRMGQLELSLLLPEGQEYGLIIAGERGEIRADLWSGELGWLEEDKRWQEVQAPCSQPIHGFAGMRESIEGFVAAIREGRPVRADLAVIRRVHGAMLACAKSEVKKAAVAVEPL